ncbi:50S ribosomal protein L5P [Fervidicoccus fontis Kam940]|uniref:Large ribosomal subunit protein uL5 n=1 Tax=Fervidicoccus fontis (strain DSM 19380 / JCM 18336 / VKM B-2539 / Kam940) TaxID=1163730 RepID=I0A0J0_FERFK|nr:50S ribosomal protein L5P [Fervidicoccus fontis Kam940]
MISLSTVTEEVNKFIEAWNENPMLKPRITKVTVNVSLGQGGERLAKIAEVLKEITNQEPKLRKAKRTIRDFGIRKGENIAVAVTLRGEKATKFLKKALEAVGNKINKDSFDDNGNVSFGIKEHISIPGVKYDPEIGVFGMDVCITIERPGYRIKRRRVKKAKRIPRRHRVKKEEAIALLSNEFNVRIV